MFRPGCTWNDVNGKPINAHLGGVFVEDQVYYWYGMNWDGPTIPPNSLPKQTFSWWLNRGINIYASRNLEDWKYETTTLADVDYAPGSLLQPLNGLVRPKVVKNDRTGRYILMAALTSPDFNLFNDVVVAVGNAPVGPFKLNGLLGWQDAPNQTDLWTRVWPGAAHDSARRIRGFDMTLFKDDDGKAYLLVAHGEVWLYELSADYLSAVRVTRMEGAEGEAPALFKADGTYYLVSSRLTGWAPNRNTYFTAASLQGPWEERGLFACGPGEATTFDTQVTYILPVPGQGNAFIFMADRFGAVSTQEIPDLRAAGHVWLPIELERRRRTMRVSWRDQWDLSVFTPDVQA